MYNTLCSYTPIWSTPGSNGYSQDEAVLFRCPALYPTISHYIPLYPTIVFSGNVGRVKLPTYTSLLLLSTSLENTSHKAQL